MGVKWRRQVLAASAVDGVAVHVLTHDDADDEQESLQVAVVVFGGSST